MLAAPAVLAVLVALVVLVVLLEEESDSSLEIVAETGPETTEPETEPETSGATQQADAAHPQNGSSTARSMAADLAPMQTAELTQDNLREFALFSEPRESHAMPELDGSSSARSMPESLSDLPELPSDGAARRQEAQMKAPPPGPPPMLGPSGPALPKAPPPPPTAPSAPSTGIPSDGVNAPRWSVPLQLWLPMMPPSRCHQRTFIPGFGCKMPNCKDSRRKLPCFTCGETAFVPAEHKCMACGADVAQRMGQTPNDTPSRSMAISAAVSAGVHAEAGKARSQAISAAVSAGVHAEAGKARSQAISAKISAAIGSQRSMAISAQLDAERSGRHSPEPVDH